MTIHPFRRLVGLGLAIGLVFVLSASAQYREYYVFGKVLDAQNKPLGGVEISVLDTKTNRSFSTTTKGSGEYKFPGLPHGVYKVTFAKKDYATQEADWNFPAPQDTMQRVEMKPIILVTQAAADQSVKLKEALAEVKQAAEKLKQGDIDGALVLVEAVLAKNPKDANALYLGGICYTRKKDYPRALAALSEVAAQNPEFAPGYQQLGAVYQQQGESEKALESYQKALALDPDNPDLMYDIGLVLFEMNRVPEALPHFEKALTFRPADPALLEMAGRSYVNQQKYELAIEDFEKAKAGYTDPEKIKFLDDLIAKIKELVKK